MAIVLFLSILLFNNAELSAKSDSLTLTYKQYLENIFRYHPIAQKAGLKMKLAQTEILNAKGNLDPIITADWNEKNFDDKLYYRQYQTKLIFPTRLGIEVVGGYENTTGVFLNPENKTDEFGLWHLGFEANILQGLLVNERSTAIKQAQVFQKLAKAEQEIILNDLIYDATIVYLVWQQYVSAQAILKENESIANTYFNNTKQSFFGGEKTAIDTLEAFIAHQDAIVLRQKNELGLIKAKQQVENYLWYDTMPVNLQYNTIPAHYQDQLFDTYVDIDNANFSSHPLILSSVSKLNILEIEQRLKREKLKPKLKIKYNPLVGSASDNIVNNFSINNYKWGINFSIPLLLRSERANIQKANIKIQETQLALTNKQNELKNKMQSSWEQQLVLQKQLNLLQNNVKSYKTLLEGENEKFNYGESSVFLLNKRQEKYIHGQLKLIDTYMLRQVEILNFLYFSNQLVR